MAKFVKFADAEIPTSGVAVNQDVFINPEFVRVVRADPHGGAVIQLDYQQQISVREDVVNVIRSLLMPGL
jgi:hypothetical protein